MSNKIYNFEESLDVGKNGEKIVYNYIKNNYKFLEIKDVSDIDGYKIKDIDLLCKYINGEYFEIEIKTDTYDTGNLFFETTSCVERNSLGCMLKTECYFLFYYFINTNELYILNMKEYRNWVIENINTFKKIQAKNKTFNSSGLLIPKGRLEKEFNKKYFRKVIL